MMAEKPAAEWQSQMERTIRRLSRRVRALEARPPIQNIIYPPGRTTDASQSRDDDAWHSDDFTSVRWYGAAYTFSTKQAAIVAELWAAWESADPDVLLASLLTAAECDGRRIDNLFRNGKGFLHPAWETMIVHGDARGTYRLKRPD